MIAPEFLTVAEAVAIGERPNGIPTSGVVRAARVLAGEVRRLAGRPTPSEVLAELDRLRAIETAARAYLEAPTGTYLGAESDGTPIPNDEGPRRYYELCALMGVEPR